MKRKLHRHSFIHRYRHVYIFISILVISGFLMGCFASRYISASDIEQLSSILTTVPEDMDQYSFFINQFFLGIVLIVAGSLCAIIPGILEAKRVSLHK